jgi:hypothetical protein
MLSILARHFGHGFAASAFAQSLQQHLCPHGAKTASAFLSMHTTQSSLDVSATADEDALDVGRAVPHLRHWMRVPKLTSLHDGQCQSPPRIDCVIVDVGAADGDDSDELDMELDDSDELLLLLALDGAGAAELFVGLATLHLPQCDFDPNTMKLQSTEEGRCTNKKGRYTHRQQLTWTKPIRFSARLLTIVAVVAIVVGFRRAAFEARVLRRKYVRAACWTSPITTFHINTTHFVSVER